MITSILLLLPSLMCFIMALVHLMLASRVRTFRNIFIFLVTIGVAALAESCFFYRDSLYGSLAIANILILFCAPSIIPTVALYLDRLLRTPRHSPAHISWVILPAGLLAATLTLSIIAGWDNVDRFLERLYLEGPSILPSFKGTEEFAYSVLTVNVFMIVMGVELAFFMIYGLYQWKKHGYKLSHITKSFRKGEKIDLLEIQVAIAEVAAVTFAVKILLTRTFYNSSPLLQLSVSVLLSLLLFFFSYFALFSSKQQICRKDLESGLRFNYHEDKRSEAVEEMMSDMAVDLKPAAVRNIISKMASTADLKAIIAESGETDGGEESLAAALFNAVSKSWHDDSLQSRFQHLMMDEQLFLQPSLSLNDVADRLHTNKTYISKMVNQTYNLGFPEVLNILRIDYAEQFITSHPGSTQEEIAKACGFLSASSFNITFKRITGFTPKVWASRKKKGL